MTDTSEYIPKDDGKANGKIFTLGKAPDPDTLLAIHTREECCETVELDFGARLLFCRLLDLALNPTLNNRRKGQIVISQTQLMERLGASKETIGRWTSELVRARFIWVTRVPRPNTHPINCYHISVFQPPKATELEVAGDGLWGNGYRRPGTMTQNVARGPLGRFLRLGVGQENRPKGGAEEEETPVLLEKTPAKGHKCDRSAVTHDPCEALKLNLPSVTHDGGQPSPMTLAKGHARRLGRVTGDGCEGSPVPLLKESQKELEHDLKSRRGEGAAAPLPPDEEKGGKKWGWGRAYDNFDRWKAEMEHTFPGKREKVQKELEGLLEQAKSPARRQEIKRRLAFLRDLRRGGLPPDELEQAPKPAPKPKLKVEISEEQLLQDAMGMIEAAQEAGIKPLLTPAHRAALKKAGMKV